MLSLEMIQDAKKVLEGVATVTPLFQSKCINPDADVYIKCENMQVTGSFKLRGAYYKTVNLTEEEAKHGVVACSAGNHAQGVALAAQKKNIPAVICMPAGAPLAKVEATRSYGAEVVLVPGVYDDAAAKATELKNEKGYTFLHPFNDDYVMAGQGTVGLEILEHLEDVEVVLVPIGGGGLISGVACAIKSLKPSCKVYGVQAAGAPSMYNSIRDGKIETLEEVSTVADGIAVKQPGDKTFEMCQKYVDGIVTVTEEEIASGILLLLEKHKMVAEGAGAVSVAAAMHNKGDIKGKKTVCVISGGNVDINILDRIIDKGLQVNGRLTKFSLTMIDKPGQLTRLLQIIAEEGANIFNVTHDRMVRSVAVGKCVVDVTVETRNKEHCEELIKMLVSKGYDVK
ncbi:threonine ammonia-lyase [Anaerotignum sp. MB30-C6]|uniref:threonine ammonia-lyase n=1 Tax=Anaerotignum sp. MB30-C6 TaxID=3070814 RepID=UPI0027DC3E15|nr:threonine ammonia-lyase [Anaerotignum sp. MB30-C6]WMI80745.1 threonine ammonia-lyase [Anaerotignum sp. MB30-C6]